MHEPQQSAFEDSDKPEPVNFHLQLPIKRVVIVNRDVQQISPNYVPMTPKDVFMTKAPFSDIQNQKYFKNTFSPQYNYRDIVFMETPGTVGLKVGSDNELLDSPPLGNFDAQDSVLKGEYM